jgi:hypothetical protein
MPATDDRLGESYLAEAREQLAKAARIIRHCLGQLNDEQLGWRPQETMNSVGNLVLHLCGNVRQWIVSGVGDKPDVRDRPAEFSERGPFARDDLIRHLNEVLAETDAVLRSVPPSALLEARCVQGFDTSRLSAIFDSVAHFKGHTQEIVHLTRMQLGDSYVFEWVPSSPEEGAP